MKSLYQGSRNGKYMSKSQLKMSNPQLNLIRKIK